MPSRVAARNVPEPPPRRHHFLDDHPQVRDGAGLIAGVTGHVLAATGGALLIVLGALLSLTFVGLGPGIGIMALGGWLVARSLIWQSHRRQ